MAIDPCSQVIFDPLAIGKRSLQDTRLPIADLKDPVAKNN